MLDTPCQAWVTCVEQEPDSRTSGELHGCEKTPEGPRWQEGHPEEKDGDQEENRQEKARCQESAGQAWSEGRPEGQTEGQEESQAGRDQGQGQESTRRHRRSDSVDRGEHRLLIVDGHDPSEVGESALLANRAILSRKFAEVVVARDFSRAYNQTWTVVWFCGHVTLYRNGRPVHRWIGSLERRRGSAFTQLARHTDMARIKARLLVLSSCHTESWPFSRQGYLADTVITYRGSLGIAEGCAFAARFFYNLAASVSKRRFPQAVVVSSFMEATANERRTQWTCRI